MAGEKKKSSFASDLFGEKDNPSSSSGIFGSIFAPPPKVLGREAVHPSSAAEKNGSGYQAWNPKTGGVSGGEGQSKEVGSYYQQEEKAQQPFDHYSSSIYYGGRDVYNRPPETSQNPVFTTFKDGGEDDSGGASRGNWWQGSLYY